MANQIIVNAMAEKDQISRMIYGHFAEHLGRCIYDGFYVGEDSPIPNIDGMRIDIIEALKKIKIPVLRWPGGCFADEYHWKDGIGPKSERKLMINTHWAALWRITILAPMNFSGCANCWKLNHIYAEMSAAEPCRKCQSGLNT